MRYALLLLGWCVLGWSGDTKVFEVGAKPKLSLHNMAGDLTVAPGKPGQISITISGAHPEAVTLRHRDDRISVRYERAYTSVPPETHFTVLFPPEGGDLEFKTLSGKIEIRGIDADVELESVSGSINLHGLQGEVEAHTVSGHLFMHDAVNIEAQLSTVSGALAVSGSFDGEYDLNTVSGPITLSWSETASFALDGATLNSEIVDTNGLFTTKKETYGPTTRVFGKIGKGKGEVTLQTVSGSISLKPID